MRAIVSASLDLMLEGVDMVPRILVPMLCTAHELEAITTLIDRAAFDVSIYFILILN